jgi:phosphoglycolate phosphatase
MAALPPALPGLASRLCEPPPLAAIVDLDGTMVDTAGDFEVALRLTLADLGWPAVDRGFISRTVGRGSEHLLQRTLAEVGAPAALYEQAWQGYQRHYLAVNGQYSSVFAGVAEGLQALRSHGLRLACLTNKPHGFARPLLAQKGLDGFFELVFGGDAFARKKPDPLPLLETCKALGLAPERVLMVGDSRNDAQAARAAGCAVMLVSYGYNHGEPAAVAQPDAVIDSLAELPALLGLVAAS